MKQSRIAIVRIKGNLGLKVTIRKTFEFMRLYKKNHCVVISNTLEYAGMIKKIDNACTWGEIDNETMLLLLQKRAKLPNNQAMTEDYLKEKLNVSLKQFTDDFMAFKQELNNVPGLKNFFKLNPPRKGFGNEGIKQPFSLGGACGYRKDKINELIKRMI